ncbi:MAG: hypothetical protein Q7R89_03250 [bacterium]|nr:hypothetical protein [bacterium]
MVTTMNRQYVEMGGANFSVYFNYTLASIVVYECGHKDWGEEFVIGEIVNSDTMVPVSNNSVLLQKVVKKFKKDRLLECVVCASATLLAEDEKMDSVLADYKMLI